MTARQGRRAVIIGGGIGGLAAAVGLHQADWQVTVLERAPSLKPLGTCIALAPNALRALDGIGVGAAFREYAVAGGNGMGGIRTPGGRWLTTLSAALANDHYGEPLVILRRGQLAAALLGALPDDLLRTGVTVTGCTPEGTVTTSDGELTADLVIGADGVWSPCRHALFPDHPAPRYSGRTVWRFVVHAPEIDYPGSETWGRGSYVGIVPLGGGEIYCFGVAPRKTDTPAANPLAAMRTEFADWHWPIPALLDHAADVEVLQHGMYQLDPVPAAFHSGRSVLLGDAAHAMLPNLGQGGCQAIEDAVVLSALLREPDVDVPRALARYTAVRRPRTADVVKRSASVASAAGLHNPVAVAARDLIITATRLLPESVLARGFAPVMDWRPPQAGQPI